MVSEGERACAFAAGFAEGGEGVGGFAALADGDDERVLTERAVEGAEFAGDFGISGEEGGGFDHAGTGHACVECGAAADDADAVDVVEGARGEPELVEVSGAVVVVETAVERAGDG